ncbi:LysM peptidoglycan-binding domain-containing protein [Desulfohalobium retbaense]|uniref:Lytic transglycosylase catalytic n=1 Tax=Desulfohalobium retbaense (strain ATCC 49708 / DSM 5692 / JCM 16813 / HR100) TaxID=485915 RepID=C8WZB4_DESRD|nr:LysM peptidoglycan-binding domain-containing protein [Desulfohalobium retbaense]ACV67389.1 Lytic transglycosylase catalytic [Desulfohalobium retbaense DSM 5692]
MPYVFPRAFVLVLLLAVGCAPLTNSPQSQHTGKMQNATPENTAVNASCPVSAAPSAVTEKAARNASKPEQQDLAAEATGSDADLKQPLEEEVQADVSSNATDKEPALTQAEKKALESEAEIQFDLDVRETERMQKFFRYYTHKHRKTFQRWLKRAEPYLPHIRKVITEKGLPQDLVFLPFAESGFNPWAYSRAGAAGLWQFMPATGRHFDLRVDWWMDERRDPYASTQAAAEYLSRLYGQFQDWYLALAAYNAGEGNVGRALERSGCDNFYDLASSRRYLKSETRNYVPKFQAILKIVRNLEELGFEPIDWDASPEPSQVAIKGGTDLMGLADATGMSWSEFRKANPKFRRTVSPPDASYQVQIPAPKVAQAKAYLDGPRAQKMAGGKRYRVRSGDSWWRIARRFDVPLTALMRLNNTRSKMLHPGDSVLIPVSGEAARARVAAQDGEYVVQRGDSLWELARRMDTTVTKLRRANNLQNTTLRVGQRLTIPGGSQKAKTRQIAQRRSNYTVKKGDTLWELSRRFGLSLNTLVQANGIGRSSALQVGQKLYIPDRGRTTQVAKAREKAAHQRLVRYTVRQGDNLWTIARRFGVSADALQDWNNLGKNELIHPGDNLRVYIQ